MPGVNFLRRKGHAPPTGRTRSVVINNTRKKRDEGPTSGSTINENDKDKVSLCNEELEISFIDKKNAEIEINCVSNFVVHRKE